MESSSQRSGHHRSMLSNDPDKDCCIFYRLIAMKIASHPRFSFSRSPFFLRDLEQKILSPVFRNTMNAGLPSFVFARWWMFNTERQHDSAQNKILFLLVYLLYSVASILKVVRNLFQTFHLDGTIWIRYRLI